MAGKKSKSQNKNSTLKSFISSLLGNLAILCFKSFFFPATAGSLPVIAISVSLLMPIQPLEPLGQMQPGAVASVDRHSASDSFALAQIDDSFDFSLRKHASSLPATEVFSTPPD